MDLGVAARDVIVHGRAAHHAVVDQQPRHLDVVQQRRAVRLRRREEPQGHPHRVHRRVGHAHRGLQLRVQHRLQAKRLLGRELLRRDARRLAPLEEARQVRHVLVVDRHEQPVVLLERTGCDRAQDAVLLDAFHRRLVVVHGVPRAAVQQAVVTSRRPRRELAAFDERDAHAAEGQVVGERAAGAAAAHDQDVCVV